MLIELRLKLLQPLRSLPILGPMVDEFADWCHRQGFTPRTIETKLFHLRHLARYFKRRGVRRWQDLRLDHFERAWEQLAGGHNSMGGAHMGAAAWQSKRTSYRTDAQRRCVVAASTGATPPTEKLVAQS